MIWISKELIPKRTLKLNDQIELGYVHPNVDLFSRCTCKPKVKLTYLIKGWRSWCTMGKLILQERCRLMTCFIKKKKWNHGLMSNIG
jgi:hypothetical protein